jgi:hypothetical protein
MGVLKLNQKAARSLVMMIRESTDHMVIKFRQVVFVYLSISKTILELS